MDIQSLKELIGRIQLPIVELAGPTLDGFELFKKHHIQLPSRPIVTNVAKEITINPFGKNPRKVMVDEVVDVKKLPYKDNSVGMFITSCLQIDDKDVTDKAGYTDGWKQKVVAEYDSLLEGKVGALDHALHLYLYRNASKALVPGGLLLQTMPFYRYAEAAEVFGLHVIYEETDGEQTVIFRKEH